MTREPMRDVVVVLPGILGSVLQKDGKDVWAMSAGGALRALVSLGGSIGTLRLDGDDPDVDDLGDGVTATRLLPDLHMVPGLWTIDGYSKVVATVKERFDVVPGENFFEFPYDWRRDNRVHARRLARESHDWLRLWRESSGNGDAKLILLAHSMGGIVSRAFLELHDGWRNTRALITFGTPYRGSLNAVGFIGNGFRKGLGPLGIDLGDFLRSLTSVYQLLPIYPCVITENGLARVTETAVPHVDAARAADAMEFHAAIQQSVEARRDPGYEIYPVVGIGQPTMQSAEVVAGDVTLLAEHGGRDMSGDGTVPRVSAMPIEMTGASAGLFSPVKHASLQNTDAVLSQVTGIITGGGIDLSTFRSEAFGKAIALDVPDAIAAGESLQISAVPAGGRAAALHAVVSNVDTNLEAWSGPLGAGVDAYETEIAGMAEGIYRVDVRSEIGEVSDFVAVLPAG